MNSVFVIAGILAALLLGVLLGYLIARLRNGGPQDFEVRLRTLFDSAAGESLRANSEIFLQLALRDPDGLAPPAWETRHSGARCQ